MRHNQKRNLFALGRLPVGKKNKTEESYGSLLELQRIAGDVLWYKFEALKLRLADNTFYTPDYMVLAKDGVLECHECKGFWTDDARVKIKVAADIYPFRFLAAKQLPKSRGGGWEFEVFSTVALCPNASPDAAGEDEPRRT